MAFGNYYGGVTNEKNILDKLAEMTKELREVKVMLINPEVQAEQIKYQVINEAKAEADKLINEAKAEAEKIRNEAKEEVRKEREQRDKSEDERKKSLDEYLNRVSIEPAEEPIEIEEPGDGILWMTDLLREWAVQGLILQ